MKFKFCKYFVGYNKILWMLNNMFNIKLHMQLKTNIQRIKPCIEFSSLFAGPNNFIYRNRNIVCEIPYIHKKLNNLMIKANISI